LLGTITIKKGKREPVAFLMKQFIARAELEAGNPRKKIKKLNALNLKEGVKRSRPPAQ